MKYSNLYTLFSTNGRHSLLQPPFLHICSSSAQWLCRSNKHELVSKHTAFRGFTEAPIWPVMWRKRSPPGLRGSRVYGEWGSPTTPSHGRKDTVPLQAGGGTARTSGNIWLGRLHDWPSHRMEGNSSASLTPEEEERMEQTSQMWIDGLLRIRFLPLPSPCKGNTQTSHLHLHLQMAATASSWPSRCQRRWGCAVGAAGRGQSPSYTPVWASGQSKAACSMAPPAACWRRRASGTAGSFLFWNVGRRGKVVWKSEGAATPTQTARETHHELITQILVFHIFSTHAQYYTYKLNYIYTSP